ncbi:hypothetical protein G1L22_12895 [Tenacibaculum finnmarkense]|uniref:hypothetical protein n=1 Tax=Tenacibaculum finnmarkense TaxID=2781243 RepID=UPI00187B940F|nr:hypothetical protein [Tenacibaculum finnmarkense]MBE7649182.1 hypothetical protein [Tenacibaculum finnmarkense genomovar ulcerans]MCG8740007.1 hypothetical protein [Tenacibaculum finnmarkense]MCG8762111.1 hypothetical protein [Tenacibaculum finnmarkense]MCG8781611.1 hypothetical protein [Tenacibaculum finnmarkense]MCG8787487.1 hypothetical protein [Tenacibaculum finnmarkense]
MTDKEKIVKYLNFKGISKNKFYNKTGFSVGFLDSGNSLGVDKLRKIIDNYHDFNPEWLLSEGKEMLKSAVIVEDPIVKEAIAYKDKYLTALEENQELSKENRSLRSKIDALQQKLLNNTSNMEDNMNRSVG